MFKKTTDQKTKKQTKAKKPVVLKDDELTRIEGGTGHSFDSFRTGQRLSPPLDENLSPPLDENAEG